MDPHNQYPHLTPPVHVDAEVKQLNAALHSKPILPGSSGVAVSVTQGFLDAPPFVQKALFAHEAGHGMEHLLISTGAMDVNVVSNPIPREYQADRFAVMLGQADGIKSMHQSRIADDESTNRLGTLLHKSGFAFDETAVGRMVGQRNEALMQENGYSGETIREASERETTRARHETVGVNGQLYMATLDQTVKQRMNIAIPKNTLPAAPAQIITHPPTIDRIAAVIKANHGGKVRLTPKLTISAPPPSPAPGTGQNPPTGRGRG